MKETDREWLLWVEAHDSWPSKKEHLELKCELLAIYLEGGPLMWMMSLNLHVNQKSDCILYIFACCVIFKLLLSYADFSTSTFLKKIFQEHHQSVKRLWFKSGPIFNILSVLIWAQTVCKGYQKSPITRTEVSKHPFLGGVCVNQNNGDLFSIGLDEQNFSAYHCK